MTGKIRVDAASHATAEDANRFAAEVQEQLRAQGLFKPKAGTEEA